MVSAALLLDFSEGFPIVCFESFSVAISQLQSPHFDPDLGLLSAWSSRVLPYPRGILSGFSSQKHASRWIDYDKLPRRVNVCGAL